MNLYQTADTVCAAASYAISYPSPGNVYPAADYDGDIQGNIQLPPTQNDDNRGAISN